MSGEIRSDREHCGDKDIPNVRLLKEGDELLLMKYADGECSRLESWRVRRLLSRRAEAREFLDQVGATSSLFNVYSERCAAAMPESMWSRVRNRLDEEERTAFFLGARRFSISSDQAEGFDFSRRAVLSGSFGSLWLSRLGWGVSGAMVTAAAAILTFDIPAYRMLYGDKSGQDGLGSIGWYPDGTKEEFSDASLHSSSEEGDGRQVFRKVSSFSPQLQNAGLNEERASVPEVSSAFEREFPPFAPSWHPLKPSEQGSKETEANFLAPMPSLFEAFNAERFGTERQLESTIQSSKALSSYSSRKPVVEIDWLRSDGTLQLIQDSKVRSALIWVKRDRPSAYAVPRFAGGRMTADRARSTPVMVPVGEQIQ